MRPISHLTRREKLLGGLDVAGTRGIEIGALAAPMLRPPEADIRFVDHADTATLRAKYAADPAVAIGTSCRWMRSGAIAPWQSASPASCSIT